MDGIQATQSIYTSRVRGVSVVQKLVGHGWGSPSSPVDAAILARPRTARKPRVDRTNQTHKHRGMHREECEWKGACPCQDGMGGPKFVQVDD